MGLLFWRVSSGQFSNFTAWSVGTVFGKHHRAIARSKNPGWGARNNVVGIMWPPVEIGLTCLPKTENHNPLIR